MFELIVYMAGVIIMIVAFSCRTPHQDIQAAVLLSVLWPASVLVMIIVKILWAFNCDINITQGAKWFGYRKPTNSQIRGFAVSMFKLEFQFWRKPKK